MHVGKKRDDDLGIEDDVLGIEDDILGIDTKSEIVRRLRC
jgi:hypothetical protein